MVTEAFLGSGPPCDHFQPLLSPFLSLGHFPTVLQNRHQGGGHIASVRGRPLLLHSGPFRGTNFSSLPVSWRFVSVSARGFHTIGVASRKGAMGCPECTLVAAMWRCAQSAHLSRAPSAPPRSEKTQERVSLRARPPPPLDSSLKRTNCRLRLKSLTERSSREMDR